MSVPQIDDQPCRICFNGSTGTISLNETVDGRTLAEMLRFCVKLEVFENDDLPYECCSDCKLDLVIAYNLVIRCKESDSMFRNRLYDKKCVVHEIPAYEANNATQDSQFKTEFKAEIECIYAEPISDVKESNNDHPEKWLHEESESSSSDADEDGDDKNDEEYIQEDAGEDESVTYQENYVDDSEVDGTVSDRKRRKYIKKKSSSSPKRCCKCKMRLENMEQVEEHSKVHIDSKVIDKQKIAARPFECSVCFKRYTKKRALLLHQQEMYIEKQFQCDECDEDFLTDAQLIDHKESHDKDKGGKKGQFPKCCACYQQFESEDMLKKHADEIHLPESLNSTNDNENQFICDICHRRYKTKRILLDHKSKPYRTKQYQCAQCGRIFRDKCALSDHERCHQGERPFVCPVCSKTFAIKDSYRKHVKSHSIEEDRFKCEVCGKGFKTKGNLKDHYITHASDYRPLSCSLCSATFARKSCLKSHMRMHTGEKPFKCDMCDASYAFSSDLKRHIMAHKGIKPYICNVCGRGYPRQDYLRKHLASHNASS